MLTYILQTYVVIQITSTFWCGPCSLLELQAWLAPLKIIGTWTRDVAVFKTQLKFTLSVHAQSEIVIVTFEAVLFYFCFSHSKSSLQKLSTLSTLSGRVKCVNEICETFELGSSASVTGPAGRPKQSRQAATGFAISVDCGVFADFFKPGKPRCVDWEGLGSCQSTNPWINSTFYPDEHEYFLC